MQILFRGAIFWLLAGSVLWRGAALAQETGRDRELAYVVIVSRHGVRSPTWTNDRLNEYSSSPWPEWSVAPGYLTPRGRQLMKILGTYFGSLFLARGPDHSGCADARRIYVWADTDQRTIESAKALAEGMLPGCGVEIHSGPENRADPLFNPLEAGIAKLDFSLAVAAIMGRTSSTLDPVLESQKPNLDLLASILNGDQRAAKSIFDQPLSLTAEGNGMRLTGPLSLASTFSENLLLEYLEGMTGNQLGWGRLDRTKLL